jgi:hypothetical protein
MEFNSSDAKKDGAVKKGAYGAYQAADHGTMLLREEAYSINAVPVAMDLSRTGH